MGLVRYLSYRTVFLWSGFIERLFMEGFLWNDFLKPYHERAMISGFGMGFDFSLNHLEAISMSLSDNPPPASRQNRD